MKSSITISILGFGNIGRALLLNLLAAPNRSYVINIIDPSDEISGTILDFAQAMQLNAKHRIVFNSPSHFTQSAFIFHCAGVGVQKGASRLTTSDDNIAITKSIFEQYTPGKNSKIIVVANPVEVITYYTWKYAQLPPQQVMGTGTFLDNLRLDYYLAQLIGDDKKIDTLMLGEHGESIVWIKSHSTIDGLHISEFLTNDQLNALESDVLTTASRIKKTQGATIYAVTSCALELMEAMLNPTETVYPISCMIDDHYKNLLGYGSMYISLPVRLDQNGVKQILSVQFNDEELVAMRKSATLINEHLIH